MQFQTAAPKNFFPSHVIAQLDGTTILLFNKVKIFEISTLVWKPEDEISGAIGTTKGI